MELCAEAHADGPGHHGDGLHVITISDPPMRGRLALTWRAEAPVSPAARALIAHARAELGEAG